MSAYENGVRQNLEGMEDLELQQRLASGTLTDEARAVAVSILNERGTSLESPASSPESIQVHEGAATPSAQQPRIMKNDAVRSLTRIAKTAAQCGLLIGALLALISAARSLLVSGEAWYWLKIGEWIGMVLGGAVWAVVLTVPVVWTKRKLFGPHVLMTEEETSLSPKSIIFWRHIVGIAVLLLFQRGTESVPYFLGHWGGAMASAFGIAALISGLGYLFFTSWLRGKVARTFVIAAWAMAGLLVVGQWVMPDLVQRIANPKVQTGGFVPLVDPPTAQGRAEIDAQEKENARVIAVHTDLLEREVPDWRSIVGRPNDTSNPFRRWLSKQPADYQLELNSTNSASVIKGAIAKFKAETAKASSSAPSTRPSAP